MTISEMDTGEMVEMVWCLEASVEGLCMHLIELDRKKDRKSDALKLLPLGMAEHG